MIRKLLVANRGEIAIRVFRAAREMGIRTVAVYSEADKNSLHPLFADERVHIGAAEAAASYLDSGKILEVAKELGVDAIHPGYGFLSERADFAEACAEAGIIFVGPSASAMRALGSKIDAKQLARKVGVPITPGYFEPGAGVEELKRAAEGIGYPVLLKASAGGGGRGMRIVRDPVDFEQEFETASEESVKAFGDGAMMVEKLVDRPRHIEAQILADSHGNVACLFERECSLQRRHQKLVEEAPSPVMTADLWSQMRAACTALIKEAGYVGAGTVEFILDPATHEFYFLEVNARLQVEHPVTEEITGLDLVQWQLKIANGEELELPLRLADGSRSGIVGHSIEARIVAEDPAQGFLPSIGRLLAWAEPRQPGIRVDTGFAAGREVSRFYDSLIAKVIAHGETREQAIDKLISALEDFHILGVKTNMGYLLDVLRHPDFRQGEFDTGFLGREFGEWNPGEAPGVVGLLSDAAIGVPSAVADSVEFSPWALADDFRNVANK